MHFEGFIWFIQVCVSRFAESAH